MGPKTCSRLRRLVWLSATIIMIAALTEATANAQTLKGEAAGGYAYLHQTDLSVPGGWFASAGASMNNWFGLVGDVSGHYRTETVGIANVKTRLHTFVAGPKFMYHANRVTPYITLLAGGAHVSTNATTASVTNTVSDTRFDAQTGVGVDLYAMRNLGVRVGLSEDYIHVNNEWNKQVRFMTGVVAHW
jgi:hypothetical protein